MAQPAARRRLPAVAALASLAFPGLGHLYLGRRRTAALYAAPAIVVLLLGLVRLVLEGVDLFALELFSPSLSLTVMGLAVVLGVWWIVAMLDAFNLAGGRRPWRRVSTAAVGAMVAAVVAVSGVSAYYAWSFYETGTQIFVGNGVDSPTPGPGSPGASGLAGASPDETPDVVPPPASTPAPGSHRVTVLLTGIDSSPTRSHALTDTMIVVSLDTQTGKLAMVSIARDIAGFKLWDGRTFSGKINSLMSYAQAHRDQFPLGPTSTLTKELSYILGVQINYYATVDLAGFSALVDAAGGVTIKNTDVIADPSYGGWTDKRPVGFYLSVGTHTLDGQSALAFARSRMGPGNNDFVRARRQQQLLLALEKKVADPAMLPKLPSLLRALGRTVKTNYPADDLGKMLAMAKSIDSKLVTQKVLGPPYAVRSTDQSQYSLTLVKAKIEALSVLLYGSDSAFATATTPSPSPEPSPSP